MSRPSGKGGGALGRKLARLRRTSWPDRLLLLRTSAWLLLADLGLRVAGFSRTRRLLGRPGRATASGPPSPEARRRAERLAWSVAVAARHHLYPMHCLRRALVLERLLAGAGLGGELRIGVRKEGEELRAHAWVEHGGRPLSEPEGVEREYAALELPPRPERPEGGGSPTRRDGGG